MVICSFVHAFEMDGWGSFVHRLNEHESGKGVKQVCKLDFSVFWRTQTRFLLCIYSGWSRLRVTTSMCNVFPQVGGAFMFCSDGFCCGISTLLLSYSLLLSVYWLIGFLLWDQVKFFLLIIDFFERMRFFPLSHRLLHPFAELTL